MRVRVALVVVAIVGAGCGWRVSPSRLAAARRGQSVTARGAAASATGGGDIGAASGSASPVIGAAASAASGSGSATGTGTGSGTGSPAAAIPAGGNGGATDVGVAATTITLGNVSTLTGPVPGVFEGAVIGTQAAVAYINSFGGIYGRQLKLDVRDDQFDTGQNRAVTLDLLGKVFAFAGSFSSYDDAAINEVKSSNIVDASVSLSDARRAIDNNFSVAPGHKGWRTGPLNYFKSKFPTSVLKTAAIYYDVPSAKSSYDGWKAAAQSVGYNIIYDRGVQPTETDFTADVVRMRSSAVKFVYLTALDYKATARLAKAVAQQNFTVDAFVSGGVAYDPNFITFAGPAANGVFSEQQMTMYNGEDASIPEVQLFNQWVRQVKPGYKPDLFAVYGWGSTRLLADALKAAGPKITRASVNDAIRKLGQYDVHGLIAPANPGTKAPPTCYILVKINNGKFERFDSPGVAFRCADGGYFKVPGTP
jgi:ABC-type branched-subunit amino acid transport system substrate-binding protein